MKNKDKEGGSPKMGEAGSPKVGSKIQIKGSSVSDLLRRASAQVTTDLDAPAECQMSTVEVLRSQLGLRCFGTTFYNIKLSLVRCFGFSIFVDYSSVSDVLVFILTQFISSSLMLSR